MVKRFKRPDGTEETIEGTPEEIAQYERALNESFPAAKTKKPGVLKGAALEDGKLQGILDAIRSMPQNKLDEILEAVKQIPRSVQFIPYPLIQWPIVAPRIWPSWEPFWCGDTTITTGTATGTSVFMGAMLDGSETKTNALLDANHETFGILRSSCS